MRLCLMIEGQEDVGWDDWRALAGALGAGWWKTEDERYGFPFHDTRTRMDVLEEQLEVVHGSFGDEAFDFDGSHYRLRELEARPKPVQRPRPR